ncbi:hypothetical protein F5B20DRAFT_567156 [Whalleya microplaca]|nr:hypothetical protein F5B20DRAFT_567156 [Whalleya microplaca]
MRRYSRLACLTSLVPLSASMTHIVNRETYMLHCALVRLVLCGIYVDRLASCIPGTMYLSECQNAPTAVIRRAQNTSRVFFVVAMAYRFVTHGNYSSAMRPRRVQPFPEHPPLFQLFTACDRPPIVSVCMYRRALRHREGRNPSPIFFSGSCKIPVANPVSCVS